MTPLLLVRNLCSAITQSSYFKICCFEKAIESFNIFLQVHPFIGCQRTPGKTHKIHLYFPSFEKNKLIIIYANFNYYLHVTFSEGSRGLSLDNISENWVSFHRKNLLSYCCLTKNKIFIITKIKWNFWCYLLFELNGVG